MKLLMDEELQVFECPHCSQRPDDGQDVMCPATGKPHDPISTGEFLTRLSTARRLLKEMQPYLYSWKKGQEINAYFSERGLT